MNSISFVAIAVALSAGISIGVAEMISLVGRFVTRGSPGKHGRPADHD